MISSSNARRLPMPKGKGVSLILSVMSAPQLHNNSGQQGVISGNSPQWELTPASKRWDSLHRHQSERSSCSSGKDPPSTLTLYPVYSYKRDPSDLQAVNAPLCQTDRSAPLNLVMISPGLPKTRLTSARAKTKRVRTPILVVTGIVSHPCHSNKSEKKPGYAHRQAIAVSRKCRIGSTSS